MLAWEPVDLDRGGLADDLHPGAVDEPPEEIIRRRTQLQWVTRIARVPNDLLDVEQVELRVREVIELAEDDEPGEVGGSVPGRGGGKDDVGLGLGQVAPRVHEGLALGDRGEGLRGYSTANSTAFRPDPSPRRLPCTRPPDREGKGRNDDHHTYERPFHRVSSSAPLTPA